MRINHALLYSGTFLVAIGAVVVAVDQGLLATSSVGEVVRWWPAAVLAIGAGLVLRHTPVSLAGGLVAAAVTGLLLGSTFAVAPRISGDCGITSGPRPVVVRAGDLGPTSRVQLHLDCGVLSVGTGDGTGWRLEAPTRGGLAPSVSESNGSLFLATASSDGLDAFHAGRNEWNLTLPRTDIAELAVTMNLAHARLNLFETNIDRLAVTANAGDVYLDASGSRLGELFGKVNLGLLRIELADFADTHGTFEVNAGGIKVCTPATLGVRVVTRDVATQVSVQGLKQSGEIWESGNYASAEHRADLDITGSFGAVDINPIGGCK
jgi:hypothetical protein